MFVNLAEPRIIWPIAPPCSRVNGKVAPARRLVERAGQVSFIISRVMVAFLHPLTTTTTYGRTGTVPAGDGESTYSLGHSCLLREASVMSGDRPTLLNETLTSDERKLRRSSSDGLASDFEILYANTECQKSMYRKCGQITLHFENCWAVVEIHTFIWDVVFLIGDVGNLVSRNIFLKALSWSVTVTEKPPVHNIVLANI